MGLRDVKKNATLAVIAAKTLLRSQDGLLVHNTGATGSVTVSLPTNSQAGDNFKFAVVAAQALVVNPTDATDVVILGGTAGTAGHGVTSSTAGNVCELTNLGGGKWLVTQLIGSGFSAN